MKRSFFYGFHISRENNSFKEIIEFNKKYKINVIQFFLKSSLSNFDLFDEDEIREVNSYVIKNKIFLVAHGALNLTKDYSKNLNEIYLFILDIYKAYSLGAKGIILHAGKISGKDCSFENIKFNVDYILKNMPDGLKLVLENTPGSKGDLGYDFNGLKKIYNLFSDEQKKRIKFCLDTCHLYVSGYDLSNSLILDFEKEVGSNKIFCIHLNDARNKFNSKLDGHAELGYGNIDIDVLKNISLVARKNIIPIIVEITIKNSSYEEQIKIINGRL